MHAYRPLSLVFLLAAAARPGPAQCPDLELSFAAPRADAIFALTAFDAGGGPRLVAGATAGLSAWDGLRWSNVPGGPNGTVLALRVHDFGAGAECVAAGLFTLAGGGTANRIARWNGNAWSALGAGFDGPVYALDVYDFGAGPALVAAGSFANSSAVPLARIARFESGGWTALGAGLEGVVRALAVCDFGAGPELFAGGDAVLGGAHLARWTGTTWSVVPNGPDDDVLSLLALGAPGAQHLVVGGAFQAAGGVPARFVARFDGSGFTALGAGLVDPSLFGGVSALLADGAGFVAGGRFETVGAPGSTSLNVARWDGTAWAAFGSGLGAASFVGVDALARFDPADGDGERLFAAGGFSPQTGQPHSIAQWTTSRWAGLRDDDAQGVVHDASQGGALSAAMWQGELVLAGEFHGVADASDARGVARWDGTRWRSLGTVPAVDYIDHPNLIRSVDLGSGPELVMGMSRHFTHDALVPLYRWNGTDWLPFVPGTLAPETTTRVDDVALFDEGSGPRLFAAGAGLRAQAGPTFDAVLRWDGSAWTRVGNGPAPATASQYVHCLEAFDDGTGAALYAGGSIQGGVQRWDGASWTVVGAGLSDTVYALCAFDDGGGAKLYASGAFHQAGGTFVNGMARWSGSAWEPVPGIGTNFAGGIDLAVHDDGSGAGPRLFAMRLTDDVLAFDGTSWAAVVSTDPYFTFAHMTAIEALPGGPGLVLHGNFRAVFRPGDPLTPQAGLTILRACPPVTSFCAGDGQDAELSVACPCANFGTNGRGCAWNSTGPGTIGARLAHQGSPGGDDLVLLADGMPGQGTSLFFQGTSPNRSGAVFGDGLRCAAGTIQRLRTRLNSGGTARVPEPGEAALSTLAAVQPGSGAVRAYQVWFRVAADFCTSAPFNLTNALSVRW